MGDKQAAQHKKALTSLCIERLSEQFTRAIHWRYAVQGATIAMLVTRVTRSALMCTRTVTSVGTSALPLGKTIVPPRPRMSWASPEDIATQSKSAASDCDSRADHKAPDPLESSGRHRWSDSSIVNTVIPPTLAYCMYIRLFVREWLVPLSRVTFATLMSGNRLSRWNPAHSNGKRFPNETESRDPVLRSIILYAGYAGKSQGAIGSGHRGPVSVDCLWIHARSPQQPQDRDEGQNVLWEL